MKDTYKLYCACKNCGHSKTFQIAKGNLPSSVVCPACGCQKLHRAEPDGIVFWVGIPLLGLTLPFIGMLVIEITEWMI